MKKVSFAIVLALFSAFLYAQSKNYDKLLAKARLCEEKKEFAYALGYYYDAMEADPHNCDQAYSGWVRLSDVISGGNPGFEDYSAFALHDEWRRLLQNAEKYWSEFPYWGVEADSVHNETVDSVSVCTARLRVFETDKNRTIRGIIIKGLENTFSMNDYRIDQSDQEKFWPEYSLFTDPSVKMLMILKTRLSLCDSNGKVLCQGQDFMLDSSKKKKTEGGNEIIYYPYINYVWEKPSAAAISAVESGEYRIVADAYSMECRVFDKAGEVDRSKSSKNNFSLPNAEFRVKGVQEKQSIILVIEQRNKEEAERSAREKKYLQEFKLETKEELLEKIISDNRLTKEYSAVFGSNYVEVICNGLSDIMRFKNAYTPDTDALNEDSNGFFCRPSNDSEDYIRGGQALQNNTAFCIHSLNPQIEEKILDTIARRLEERARLLEERIPLVRSDILKFIAKSKPAREGIMKKFCTEVYSEEYIEARLAELLESAYVEADKKGKYSVTKEGKDQLQ